MGSLPRVTVGLAACALMLGAAPSASAQDPRAEPGVYAKSDTRAAAGGGSGVRISGRPTKVAAAPEAPESKGPPSESPANRPSDPTPSPVAVGAVSASAAPAHAAAPASLPSGLSADAPDTAPHVGVVGRGRSKGSASPAATPEPTTLLLMGAGLAGLYGLRRRR